MGVSRGRSLGSKGGEGRAWGSLSMINREPGGGIVM